MGTIKPQAGQSTERIRDLREDNEKLRRERDAAEKSRDAALVDLAAATDKANKRYLAEIDRLHQEVEVAKAGHEVQTRNTLAFLDDFENLQADLAESRKEARELAEYVNSHDRSFNPSTIGVLARSVLAR